MRAALSLMLLVSTPAMANGDAAAGELTYGNNCGICHGKAADGQGAAAMSMKPKPTDFTNAAWWAGKTDDGIKAIIKNGKPNTPMIAFSHLSDAEIDNVIAFLKTKKPAE